MKDFDTSGLNFKKSNIRIWIHQRNLANLQQVVWEGHGSKLLVEHSNNQEIKKFLDEVPHIMGLIKDIHTDVINDELEKLQKHINSPIPNIVLSGKDINGLSPLHKAAGLGKEEIAQFIITEFPKSINSTDAEGRTPLHFAALLKDDDKMLNLLLENGADESTLDNKQKTAAYYKTRTSEIDSKLLTVIPEFPRTAKESFLANFDWSMLFAATPSEEVQKIAKKLLNGNSEKNEEKLIPSEEEAPKHTESIQEPEEVIESKQEEEGVSETENIEANNNQSEENNADDNNNDKISPVTPKPEDLLLEELQSEATPQP